MYIIVCILEYYIIVCSSAFYSMQVTYATVSNQPNFDLLRFSTSTEIKMKIQRGSRWAIWYPSIMRLITVVTKFTREFWRKISVIFRILIYRHFKWFTSKLLLTKQTYIDLEVTINLKYILTIYQSALSRKTIMSQLLKVNLNHKTQMGALVTLTSWRCWKQCDLYVWRIQKCR